MHVPGGRDAGRHLECVDHGLLDFLILTAQVGTQNLRQLGAPALRDLGGRHAGDRRKNGSGARQTQESTTYKTHRNLPFSALFRLLPLQCAGTA
jgi:hypothetical protein